MTPDTNKNKPINKANLSSQHRAKEVSSINIPQIFFPKGGGVLKGVDEEFEVNTSIGTINFTILTSSGRNKFYPKFSPNYNSGLCNSPFGLSWLMDLPFIQRRIEKQLSRYDDCN